MADRWEYKSLMWKVGTRLNGEAETLGLEGWELASVVAPRTADFISGIHHGKVVGFFKRRIVGPPEEPA